MQRNAIIFLLVCCFTVDCLSQQYAFVHYTPKDGLVNNRARLIYQDKKGLLYIGTYAGLSVYDGSRFTNYTAENGLSSNMINDVVEMSDDSVWIISNTSKIQCLTNGKIKDVITSDHFYPVINKMIRHNDGSYYAFADEGLFKFEKNHFTKINLTDSNNKDAGLFFMTGIEAKNKLFITTDLSVQAPGGPGRLIVYDIEKNKTVIDHSVTYDFTVQAPRGDILVATGKGIKKIDETALQQNKIKLVDLPAIYHAVENLLVSCMYFDRQQNLWLCTSYGMAKIDTTGQIKWFTVENGLPVNNPSSVFQDKEGTMWFGNEQTGISKLTNLHFEFYSRLKTDFWANDVYSNDETDSIWFIDAGINKLLLQYGNTSKEFQLGNDLLMPQARLIAAYDGKYCLADMFNLYACHFYNENKIRLTKLYTDSTRNTNLAYSCLEPDKHGNFIASSDRLFAILQNNKVISYPLGYFADGFAITSNNRLWVVTRESNLFLFKIHPENPDHYFELLKVYNKELPNMTPRSIAVDKNGNVWVGTRDRGVYYLFFDGPSLRSWKQVSVKNGLSDNFVSYLHVDEDNNIWICSPAGLDKIQLKGEKFFIENVTLNNNIYQHIGKIKTTKSGMHWIITGAGVIKIGPDKTMPGDFQPKILFREIDQDRNMIDKTAGISSFSYKQNNFSFSLAVPSFIDEKQVRFSYLLEGSTNKLWSDTSSQAVINLVNLAPGKYTLKAKAVFVNHHYPDSEVSYSFIIHPPWWQTLWFRLCLAVIAMLILVAITRGYYRRKMQKQKMLLEKQQAIEKERSRIATDMHDDLGAGLSTIRFLSEKVKRNTFSDVTKDDIDKMQTASNDLIDKMNEIIWSMNEKNDSLEDLIFYTRSYAMEYCEDNNLDCSIHLPENIPSYVVSGEIRRNIFLTVKESLHNIVKHACAQHVDIIIDVNDSLDISIRDNGIGLQENHKTAGGNGLRNMRKRIESIGGNIDMLNGDGITIALKVPLG